MDAPAFAQVAVEDGCCAHDVPFARLCRFRHRAARGVRKTALVDETPGDNDEGNCTALPA
jgi:hypothetical protein